MNTDKELETLLSEQRHELKAAKALESDLDFAFQLQFQEAINASLSLHPNPNPNPSSSSSSSHTHTPNDAIPSPGLAHLLDEEIAKFEREYHDRLQAETEMIKLQNDLNRRIHDQAFARELLHIPQTQWAKTGDHIHKPFGEGSSIPGGGESFGLYFKGLMTEQNVGSVTRLLGGIGVAICDGNDNLVFELCKPLMGGVEVTEEVADLKALMEGLDSAITLGIKRLIVFCHDNSIYHYVTGKWIPRQGHIMTMVDQVSLLQRKFTHCNPSLVAQKDIKYAFKLAREAIVSQATQPAKRARGKNLIETCVICLEDTDADQMFSVNNCLHRYCISCMKQHVEAKLLQGILPKCPHEGCKSDMKIESCKKFLTSELFDIMSQRIKENSIPAADKIYCPYPKCSALMSKHDFQRCAIITFAAGQAGTRKCIKCHGLFCINCKVPWHKNLSCDDYRRLNPYPCAEDAKLKNLARRNLWRQCVKCNHMVELTEGCYHIYCRCGYEFCYTCGAEWKNKKATCNCPIWDERNIVYDTNNRRQQRRG